MARRMRHFLINRRMVMSLDFPEGIDEISMSFNEVEFMSSFSPSETSYSLEEAGNVSQDMFARGYDGRLRSA